MGATPPTTYLGDVFSNEVQLCDVLQLEVERMRCAYTTRQPRARLKLGTIDIPVCHQQIHRADLCAINRHEIHRRLGQAHCGTASATPIAQFLGDVHIRLHCSREILTRVQMGGSRAFDELRLDGARLRV